MWTTRKNVAVFRELFNPCDYASWTYVDLCRYIASNTYREASPLKQNDGITGKETFARKVLDVEQKQRLLSSVEARRPRRKYGYSYGDAKQIRGDCLLFWSEHTT